MINTRLTTVILPFHDNILLKVGLFFSHRCLVFLKKCPEYFGVIYSKRPKNVFLQHIFTQTGAPNSAKFRGGWRGNQD